MKWTATSLLCLALTSCAAPGGSSADAQLDRQLRARIEAAYDFGSAGAVDRMMSLYPPDTAVVSASGGRITTSADSLRRGIADFWQHAGVNMRNPRWQWDQVHVRRLGPDAAVLTGSWSIPHTAPTGRPHVIRGAWTAVFQRMGGDWFIVHEHLSAPDD